MLTIAQIDSATVATRSLTEKQIAALRPLVGFLADWERMDFNDYDDARFRAGCRESARASIGEDLAAALLQGCLESEVERIIDARLHRADRAQFREAFAAEISAAKATR